VTGHYKIDMGKGQAVLQSKDPEGGVQEMWALFAATRPPARSPTPGLTPDSAPARQAHLSAVPPPGSQCR
jgi:hypothetical protein